MSILKRLCGTEDGIIFSPPLARLRSRFYFAWQGLQICGVSGWLSEWRRWK